MVHRIGIILLAWCGVCVAASNSAAQDWPFNILTRPHPPQLGDRLSCGTPVDNFVLFKLQQKGLQFSAAADRRTFIRRLSLDLTGLLPSPQEVERFVADRSPQAWTRLVERLLASPRFGERWGQHWLDVARYADSDGFEYDDPRPHAWRYRDWVIGAFNQDLPFRDFVRQQIAGDELYAENPAALAATGLHRLGPLRLNAGMQDEEKNRQEVLTEMTDAIGAAFLGLTIGCARCHDHKFDDFSQADYYRLQSFFAATVAVDVSLAGAQENQHYQRSLKKWRREYDDLTKKIEAYREKHGRDSEELTQAKVLLDGRRPAPPPSVMAALDKIDPVPTTHVLHRGTPGRRLEKVQPRFPQLLDTNSPSGLWQSGQGDGSSGRRSAMARWLTDRQHPLTARVFANRVWQWLIGRGIVGTPNDFGIMGQAPTHPELLDWLAMELIESGWSVKHLVRRIVLSAAYQQSSEVTAAHQPNLRADPDNHLLWRMNRRRLEAEVMRDTVLQISGHLNLHTGGPGVRLPLHPEIARLQYKGTWRPHRDPNQHVRRSIYLFVKRNNRPPLLESFDAPTTMASCGRRTVSNHPGQALSLMNSSFFINQSSHFAARIGREAPAAGPAAQTQIHAAYRLALGRDPTPQELAAATGFLREQALEISRERRNTTDERRAARKNSITPEDQSQALSDFCQVLLNLDEFLYIR